MEPPPAAPVMEGASPASPPRLAFVIQFGSRAGGFYSDVLLGLMCSDARGAGHEAHLMHVYWEGDGGEGDGAVGAQLEAFARDRQIDVLVVERVLGRDQIAALRRLRPGLTVVLIARSEGFARVEGVDWVVVDDPEAVTPGKRGHPTDEIRRAFAAWLAAPEGERPAVPGVAPVVGGEAGVPATSIATLRGRGRLPFAPALDPVVLAARFPVPRHHYTVFGNLGCPYARDVAEQPAYRSLPVLSPSSQGAGHVARWGCAFCHMGGDYEKRADAEVVDDLLEQAGYLTRGLPDLDRVLLSDQSPQRYLARLLRTAHERGIRPIRWLFQTRADYFLRDRSFLEEATRVAAETGAFLELYLVGFESFSDEELGRYNKGVDSEQLVSAIAAMRAMRTSSGGRFTFSEAKGHSLILFNPWTRPENLVESADNLRAHGLGELFRDIAWNRLRLYPTLPIYHLAKHDGLLAEGFADGEAAQTTRAKGYSVEVPWRFADARTALAYELNARLKGRLGRERELPVFRAVALHCASLPRPEAPSGEASSEASSAELARVERGLASLAEAMRQVEQGAMNDGERASPVLFGGACNNGCEGCQNRDTYLETDEPELFARVDAAREKGLPLVFGGREPTLHPAFARAVARARGDDRRPVAVVTNGRRFSHAPFARAALEAGLSAASVKLFGASARVADAYARDDGAHAQSLGGVVALRRLGARVELRATLHAGMLGEARELAELAQRAGTSGLRIEVPIDALGLSNLERAAEAVARLLSRARELGVPLRAVPLSLGARAFDVYPPEPPRRSHRATPLPDRAAWGLRSRGGGCPSRWASPGLRA